MPELMVVIALIGVLSAIAAPNLLRGLPEKRLRAAARTLYADMQRARMSAVRMNRKIPVRFVGGAGEQYYYFDVNNDKKFSSGEFKRDLKEFGDIDYGCGGTSKNWNKDDIRPSGLPADPRVTFNIRGTCDSRSIYLKQDGAVCYAVTTTDYGYIKIRKFDGASWDEQ